MKALEILRKSKLFIEQQLSEFTKNTISYDYKILSEAIKELEDLKERILHLESIETHIIMKENKSCYDCKNWCQEFQSIGICDKGIKEEKQFRESMTWHNFCCNRWENKQ